MMNNIRSLGAMANILFMIGLIPLNIMNTRPLAVLSIEDRSLFFRERPAFLENRNVSMINIQSIVVVNMNRYSLRRTLLTPWLQFLDGKNAAKAVLTIAYKAPGTIGETVYECDRLEFGLACRLAYAVGGILNVPVTEANADSVDKVRFEEDGWHDET